MTKKELLQELSAASGQTQGVVDAVLESLAETIAAEVSNGREVAIPGVCKVDRGWRGPRKGRNPATGEPYEIGGRWAPKFKALKLLKESVSE